jgi:hypothetical protein
MARSACKAAPDPLRTSAISAVKFFTAKSAKKIHAELRKEFVEGHEFIWFNLLS